MTTKREITIPDRILDIVVKGRPDLASVVRNLRLHPNMAATLEKTIADNYRAIVDDEAALTFDEQMKLGACSVGKPYGQKFCQE